MRPCEFGAERCIALFAHILTVVQKRGAAKNLEDVAACEIARRAGGEAFISG